MVEKGIYEEFLVFNGCYVVMWEKYCCVECVVEYVCDVIWKVKKFMGYVNIFRFSGVNGYDSMLLFVILFMVMNSFMFVLKYDDSCFISLNDSYYFGSGFDGMF